MASSRLKSYGIAAGLAVLTASGIVGITVVAFGVTMTQCSLNGAGPAGCAPEPHEVAAAVVTAAPAAPVIPDARPAEVQPFPELPAKRAVAALPRRESSGVAAAAAAVMADEIAIPSISVTPARVAAEAKPAPSREEAVAVAAAAEPAQRPAAAVATPSSTVTAARKAAAAPAGAPKFAPLPVPEPLAPEVQEAAAEAAVASELSVAPLEAATIAGDAVNVRAAPSASGKRLYVFRDGTEVEPSERSRGWVKIADAEGRSGWVDAELLANVDLAALPEVDPPAPAAPPPPAPEPAPAPANQVGTVGGSGVNVRSGPSNGSTRLFALTSGTKVEVTGKDKGWLKILDPEGRSGWAYSDYID